MLPFVSIVVPVHNCLKYTQQFWANLPTSIGQEILIDNASDDGTMEWVVKNFSESSGFTYILNKEPLSVAASWNRGIQLAFGSGAMYVFVANNDIVITPSTIDILLRWKFQGLDVPTVYAVPGLDPSILKSYNGPHELALPPDFCGFLVDTAIMNRVGDFDEEFKVAYIEDIDWVLRAKMAKVKVAACLDAPVFHYGSRTIKEGNVDHMAAFEANSKYFIKKHGFDYEKARQIISKP